MKRAAVSQARAVCPSYAQHSACTNPSPSARPLIIPIIWMRKLRLPEVKPLAQGGVRTGASVCVVPPLETYGV